MSCHLFSLFLLSLEFFCRELIQIRNFFQIFEKLFSIMNVSKFKKFLQTLEQIPRIKKIFDWGPLAAPWMVVPDISHLQPMAHLFVSTVEGNAGSAGPYDLAWNMSALCRIVREKSIRPWSHSKLQNVVSWFTIPWIHTCRALDPYMSSSGSVECDILIDECRGHVTRELLPDWSGRRAG